MSWIPLVISGISGLSSLLSNNSSNSSQNTSGSTTNQTTSTATPNLSLEQQLLQDQIGPAYSQLLYNIEDPASLTGYQTNAAQGIADNTNLQKQQAQETLASKGIGGNSAATAASGNAIDASKYNQLTALNTSLPLIQNQELMSALGLGNSIESSMPVGNTTTNTGVSQTQGTGTGSSSSSGNPLTNLGATLAYLYGSGGFNTGGSGGGVGSTPSTNPNALGS